MVTTSLTATANTGSSSSDHAALGHADGLQAAEKSWFARYDLCAWLGIGDVSSYEKET
jgi:hypothetical protein